MCCLLEMLLSCSSSIICSCLVLLVSLFVFRKDVCKKFPKFPLLCGKIGGGTGSGTGSNVGTRVTNGTKGRANVSTFGGAGDDNDEGFIGVNLKHWKGISFDGKPVYPIAVHMDDGAAYIYKVLEVKADGLPSFYGLVTDVCDVSSQSCNNKTKNGLNFLIDIHMSAWPALGMSVSQGKNYLKTGTYRVIGEIKSTEIPRSLWMPKVQAGKDSIVCSCTGSCNDKKKEVVWKELGKC